MTIEKENDNDNTPFNWDFCMHLEYRLGETFELSNLPELRGFWCDGVSCIPTPDSQLNRKYVNDKRNIITKAWIGKNGQDEYLMTIKFGKYSLRRYAKGSDMIDCIPNTESMEWIDIDIHNKTITVELR